MVCGCSYLGSRLLADLLDLLKLLLSGLLRVVLGLLVAAGVLSGVSCCSSSGRLKRNISCLMIAAKRNAKAAAFYPLTSVSKDLNSVSFCDLYSSISFWASDLASFTLLVRSGVR
jgi:hypothetical protein